MTKLTTEQLELIKKLADAVVAAKNSDEYNGAQEDLDLELSADKVIALLDVIQAQAAQIDALQADAEWWAHAKRYIQLIGVSGPNLDTAIDAAKGNV